MDPQISSDVEERIRKTRFVAFDFDGVFTDNTVLVLADGSEAVRCWRGDGLGLRKLERLGIGTAVVSTEENPIVSLRCRKLGIRCVQGVQDKRSALETIARELGVPLSKVAFVGNDINDLPCLKLVGFSIAVQDAHPDVAPYAHYRTRAAGGRGAVREICDMFDQVMGSKDELRKA